MQAEMLELFDAGEFESFSRAIQRATVDHKNSLSFFAFAQNAFDAPANSGEPRLTCERSNNRTPPSSTQTGA